jgi:hypothetical protein
VIVAAVLVVLRDVAFGGMVTDQHIDLLSFWLPAHCFLGEALAAGTVPVWNPHVMAGLPFAADPQSGWLYLPAMILHSLLPCGAALGLFIVAQPILAGLGLFWFLRSERLSRVSATVGGLAIALGIASARMLVALPIGGSLAWIAILLFLASRALRASRLPSMLGWSAAAAGAWGQLGAAHLSHGLVIGTLALLAYVVARTAAAIRGGERTVPNALVGVLLLFALLVPVNLALLLPRIAYLSEASLGLGYEGLERLAARLSGGAPVAMEVGSGVGAAWPAELATSPGGYLGAMVILLSVAGWWSRRERPLAVAFSVLGALFYLASLDAVARAMAPVARSLPMGDFYLHDPTRFQWGAMVVLPVLGALGVESWRTARSSTSRVWMLAVGASIWGAIVLMAREAQGGVVLPAVATLGGIAVLAAAARTPRLGLLLPLLMALELVANGLMSQAVREQVEQGGRDSVSTSPFAPFLRANVRLASYLEEGKIVRAIRAEGGQGRFMTVRRGPSGRWNRGYHSYWDPRDRGRLNNHRAMLFGLEDAQGYNPIQLRPYWMFLRYGQPRGMGHNRAVLRSPTPTQLDLLQVQWINAPVDRPPRGSSTPVAREGPWGLYRRTSPPRATVVSDWLVEPDEVRALELVFDEGFDPSRLVILDRPPGPEIGAPEGGPGEARYEALGPGEARVLVSAPRPAVLLVRNSYHRGWRAAVDGRPTEVLQANGLLQAVIVPAGESVVRLRFEDPRVGQGLVGSAVVLLLVAAGAGGLWLRERRGAGERRARPVVRYGVERSP